MNKTIEVFLIVLISCFLIASLKFRYSNSNEATNICSNGPETKLNSRRSIGPKFQIARLINLLAYNDMRLTNFCSYVAKGDLLYYGRIHTNGIFTYFIVDHKNISGYKTYAGAPMFYSEEELQEFVKIHYPHVRLMKCTCGCWSETK